MGLQEPANPTNGENTEAMSCISLRFSLVRFTPTALSGWVAPVFFKLMQKGLTEYIERVSLPLAGLIGPVQEGIFLLLLVYNWTGT